MDDFQGLDKSFPSTGHVQDCDAAHETRDHRCRMDANRGPVKDTRTACKHSFRAQIRGSSGDNAEEEQ